MKKKEKLEKLLLNNSKANKEELKQLMDINNIRVERTYLYRIRRELGLKTFQVLKREQQIERLKNWILENPEKSIKMKLYAISRECDVPYRVASEEIRKIVKRSVHVNRPKVKHRSIKQIDEMKKKMDKEEENERLRLIRRLNIIKEKLKNENFISIKRRTIICDNEYDAKTNNKHQTVDEKWKILEVFKNIVLVQNGLYKTCVRFNEVVFVNDEGEDENKNENKNDIS